MCEYEIGPVKKSKILKENKKISKKNQDFIDIKNVKFNKLIKENKVNKVLYWEKESKNEFKKCLNIDVKNTNNGIRYKGKTKIADGTKRFDGEFIYKSKQFYFIHKATDAWNSKTVGGGAQTNVLNEMKITIEYFNKIKTDDYLLIVVDGRFWNIYNINQLKEKNKNYNVIIGSTLEVIDKLKEI
jgi:hypothetical protein